MSIRISSFTIARSVLLCAVTFVLPLISHAQPRGSTEKVRITYAANNLGFLQMFLAKDRGFYAAQGIEPELIRVSPVAAVSALIGGDADYTELLTSSVRAAAKGAPIRVVSMSVGAPFFHFASTEEFDELV